MSESVQGRQFSQFVLGEIDVTKVYEIAQYIYICYTSEKKTVCLILNLFNS